jgi:hypothetical protein
MARIRLYLPPKVKLRGRLVTLTKVFSVFLDSPRLLLDSASVFLDGLRVLLDGQLLLDSPAVMA